MEAILNGENLINVQFYVKQIEQLYYKNKLGPSTEAIFKAAQAKDIPVERMGDESLLRIGTGSRQSMSRRQFLARLRILPWRIHVINH